MKFLLDFIENINPHILCFRQMHYMTQLKEDSHLNFQTNREDR